MLNQYNHSRNKRDNVLKLPRMSPPVDGQPKAESNKDISANSNPSGSDMSRLYSALNTFLAWASPLPSAHHLPRT